MLNSLTAPVVPLPNQRLSRFIALLVLLRLAVALPATLEIDLIFPRNETYKRVYPFPLVFALQGASEAWPHHLILDWRMMASNSTILEAEVAEGVLPRDLPQDLKRETGSSAWTSGRLPDGQDPFIWVSSAPTVINSTAKEFTISWNARFVQNCSARGSPFGEPGAGPQRYIANGTITLKIDDDGGVDPKTALQRHSDTCPASLITMRMAGSVEAGETPPCIILDGENLNPQPNPCQVKEIPGLDSLVEKRMLETASCTAGSWPAATLVASCNHNMTKPSESGSSPFRGANFGPILLGLATWLILTSFL